MRVSTRESSPEGDSAEVRGASVRPPLADVDTTELFADLREAVQVLQRWSAALAESAATSLRPVADATEQFGYGGRRVRTIRRIDELLSEADGLATKAASDSRRDILEQAVEVFSRAAVEGASPNSLARDGAAFGALVLAMGRFIGLPANVRSLAERGTNEAGAGRDHWELVGSTDEEEFEADLHRIRAGVSAKPLDDTAKLPGSPGLSQFPPLAELIARPGAATSPGVVKAAKYSQSKLRLLGVELEGFRGTPKRSALDFVGKDGRPSSVLIFGDNGVGKSTIVDAVEFALQGRIGRSSDLESSLAPAAVSYASNGFARSAVRLSDGTTVEREVLVNSSGRYVSDGPAVQNDFSHAPVSFKRTDILQFLDTGAMSRGTLLFDYFPEDTRALGLRPDEEQRALGDEIASLYVRRRRMAAELAPILGVAPTALENASEYHAAVKNYFYPTGSVEDFRASGGWDRVDANLREVVLALRNTHIRLRQLRRVASRGPELLNPKRYQRHSAAMKHRVERVSEELTRSFLSITRAKHILRIRVAFAESGPLSLDLLVYLSGGQVVFPQQIFSEGYKDLLALLFFLAVSRDAANEGQAQVLLLDDVLQSVDAGVREGVMEYVLESFPGWQLIVTVHDRLWLERLRSLMGRRGHRFVEHRIFRWSFDGGPSIDSAVQGQLAALDRAMSSADVSSICAEAGRALEMASNQLSWRMGTSVTRRREDKYTLADLWPGVAKQLRRTSLSDLVAAVEKNVDLRNLVGAHYNEWAESLPLEHAESFGRSVSALVAAVRCSQCGEWMEKSKDGSSFMCGCGGISVESKR